MGFGENDQTKGPAMSAERQLVLFLRIYGGVLLLAFGAVVMPAGWMKWSYEELGLGVWPEETPLLEYLARTASLLYGCAGGALVLMSFDVPRYRPLIRLVGWISLPAAVYLLVLDLALEMPWWWNWSEGAAVYVSGLALLWLLNRCPSAPLSPEQQPR